MLVTVQSMIFHMRISVIKRNEFCFRDTQGGEAVAEHRGAMKRG